MHKGHNSRDKPNAITHKKRAGGFRMWQILLLNILSSMTYPLSKGALAYSSPLCLTSIRLVISGLVLLFFCKRKTIIPLIKKGNWLTLVKIAFLSNFVYITAECWSLQYLSNAKAYGLYLFSPFISALFGYFVFGEKFTKNKYVGLLLGIIGCLPLIVTTGTQGLSSITPPINFLPEFVMLLGVAATSYAWFLTSRLLKEGFSPFALNGITTLLGGFFSTILLILNQNMIDFHSLINLAKCKPFWLHTLCLIVLINLIVDNTYYHMLKKHSIAFMILAEFIGIAVSIVHDRICLNEPFSLPVIIGFVSLSSGIYIFQKETTSDNATQPETTTSLFKPQV